MATVLRRNKKPLAVKNLGWLLHNHKQVERLGFNYAHDYQRGIDGELVAMMKEGVSYISEYASLPVCWNWLDRPVFMGLPFRFVRLLDGSVKDFTIGDTEWRMLGKMDFRSFFGQLGIPNR